MNLKLLRITEEDLGRALEVLRKQFNLASDLSCPDKKSHTNKPIISDIDYKLSHFQYISAK